MFTLSTAVAWPIFAFFVALLWVVALLSLRSSPETRRHQMAMILPGLVGGPVISIPYATDFWRPLTVHPIIPFEAMLFGCGFLGLVTALTLFRVEFIAPEQPRSVLRRRKAYLLSAMVLGWLVLWGMEINSVVATIAMLALGTIFLVGQRPDLAPLVFRGALVSVGAFAVLVGGFVLVMANADELGRVYSLFYAKHGAFWTAFVLGLWSAAFGAFFGPFVLWWKNLRCF